MCYLYYLLTQTEVERIRKTITSILQYPMTTDYTATPDILPTDIYQHFIRHSEMPRFVAPTPLAEAMQTAAGYGEEVCYIVYK